MMRRSATKPTKRFGEKGLPAFRRGFWSCAPTSAVSRQSLRRNSDVLERLSVRDSWRFSLLSVSDCRSSLPVSVFLVVSPISLVVSDDFVPSLRYLVVFTTTLRLLSVVF